MLHKSIRWRIQAWHGFMLVCLVSGLILAFYAYEHRRSYGDLDSQLREAAQIMLPRVGRMGGGPPDGFRPNDGNDGHRPPPRPDGAPLDDFDRPDGPPGGDPQQRSERDAARIEASGVYTVAWSAEEKIVLRAGTPPTGLAYPFNGDQPPRPNFRTRDGNREFMTPMPRGEVLLVGLPIAKIQRDLNQLAVLSILVGAGIVALGLAVGWWAAGRALQPIESISAAAKKISEGDLSKRINVSETESELGQLATVLNGAFAKVESMIDDQLRFTADASHELRTPIAVLLTQIQLALSRERTAEEYKKTLETCERAAERLRVLVNQLIELSRADAGDASLVWEKCDLGRVGRDAIEFITPLAQKKNVTLQHSIESIRVKADVMKLGQVLINLLNNAIHHNQEGIEVSLNIERVGDKALIRVADTGVGIPADALPHLFDRFYRVDKARARGKGNSGLGLAICKAIIEGHGGTIRAESQPGKGATFIIELLASGRSQSTSTQTAPSEVTSA